MNDYCAFSRSHACLKWTDYEMTRHELEEADELCHSNWEEIERKETYIHTLQDLLSRNGIDYPAE